MTTSSVFFFLFVIGERFFSGADEQQSNVPAALPHAVAPVAGTGRRLQVDDEPPPARSRGGARLALGGGGGGLVFSVHRRRRCQDVGVDPPVDRLPSAL